ncbi:TSUP family transporter [Pseudomonas sp. NPDC007930]|uniref:sulfite exporter TauE/SafE family protein n=1 Tax=Pseudomonas sp. NPDC007930 TaxID=3364417 RepID=UPI0036EFC979
MFMGLAALAGLIRGYTGFGFAMILALGLLTRLPPALVIPVTLMLDLACSVGLWPGAWRRFDRALARPLLLGMLLALPLGSGLLAWLPGRWLAPLIALFCLAGGLLVLWRPAAVPARPPRPGAAWLAGLGSGLATSLASAGGPPLMLYLLRSGLAPAPMRATAIVFFFASSACALLMLLAFGVLGQAHLALAASLLLPALAGSLAGQWLHRHWPPRSVRGVMGGLLVVLSVLTLYSSLVRF